MVDLKEKTKVNAKQKKKNKKASGGAGGAAAFEMNGESVISGQTVETGKQLSEEEEDETSSTNSSLPPSGKKRNVFIDLKKTECCDFLNVKTF